MYFAHAVRARRDDGLWEAWLEFIGRVKTRGRSARPVRPSSPIAQTWSIGRKASAGSTYKRALAGAESTTEAMPGDRAAREDSPYTLSPHGDVYFGLIAPAPGQSLSPTRTRFISKKRTGGRPGMIRSPTSRHFPSLMTAVYRIVIGPAGISQV